MIKGLFTEKAEKKRTEKERFSRKKKSFPGFP